MATSQATTTSSSPRSSHGSSVSGAARRATRPLSSRPRTRPSNSTLPTANASAQARALDFVRVEGTKFFAGCDEYKIAGWNTYTLIEQAARLPVGSFEANFSLDGRRQVLDMLDAAVDAGFNTVRTWAYSVGKHQSLQIAPGVYHEPLFDGLDWVVYQAGLHGVRLILVFTDYWEYNGGVAQYMDWAGVTAPTKNAFFTDRECKRLYKANARARDRAREPVHGYRISRRPRRFRVGAHQRTQMPQLRSPPAGLDRGDGQVRQVPRC